MYASTKELLVSLLEAQLKACEHKIDVAISHSDDLKYRAYSAERDRLNEALMDLNKVEVEL